MAKRKTIRTMSADERLKVRLEMITHAERMLHEEYPQMTRGAVRVKAYKFVEDSLQKEIKAWQN